MAAGPAADQPLPCCRSLLPLARRPSSSEERERVRYKKEEESKSDDGGAASHGRLPTHDRVGLAAGADRRKLS